MLYPLSYGGRIRILTITPCGVAAMSEESVQKTVQCQAGWRGWRIVGWVMLGAVLGAALVVAFLAYSQPELLLEQLNLRYCG